MERSKRSRCQIMLASTSSSSSTQRTSLSSVLRRSLRSATELMSSVPLVVRLLHVPQTAISLTWLGIYLFIIYFVLNVQVMNRLCCSVDSQFTHLASFCSMNSYFAHLAYYVLVQHSLLNHFTPSCLASTLIVRSLYSTLSWSNIYC